MKNSIIIAGCVGLVVLLMTSGCGRKQERTVMKLANDFFTHIREGREEAAYALLAEGASSPGEFSVALDETRLRDHQRVIWDVAYIDADYGRVRGSVVMPDAVLEMEVWPNSTGRYPHPYRTR